MADDQSNQFYEPVQPYIKQPIDYIQDILLGLAFLLPLITCLIFCFYKNKRSEINQKMKYSLANLVIKHSKNITRQTEQENDDSLSAEAQRIFKQDNENQKVINISKLINDLWKGYQKDKQNTLSREDAYQFVQQLTIICGLEIQLADLDFYQFLIQADLIEQNQVTKDQICEYFYTLQNRQERQKIQQSQRNISEGVKELQQNSRQEYAVQLTVMDKLNKQQQNEQKIRQMMKTKVRSRQKRTLKTIQEQDEEDEQQNTEQNYKELSDQKLIEREQKFEDDKESQILSFSLNQSSQELQNFREESFSSEH